MDFGVNCLLQAWAEYVQQTMKSSYQRCVATKTIFINHFSVSRSGMIDYFAGNSNEWPTFWTPDSRGQSFRNNFSFDALY